MGEGGAVCCGNGGRAGAAAARGPGKREAGPGAAVCDRTPTHPPARATLLPPQVLQSRGCEKLVLQVGRGALTAARRGSPAPAVEAFRFKDSLAEELQAADLVISHAGRAPFVRRACCGGGSGRRWDEVSPAGAHSECSGPQLELRG